MMLAFFMGKYLEFVGKRLIAFYQIDIGMSDVFGEFGGICGDTRDLGQISLGSDAGSGGHIEARR